MCQTRTNIFCYEYLFYKDQSRLRDDRLNAKIVMRQFYKILCYVQYITVRGFVIYFIIFNKFWTSFVKSKKSQNPVLEKKNSDWNGQLFITELFLDFLQVIGCFLDFFQVIKRQFFV